MSFTRFSSTDAADIAALLNRLGDEISADVSSAGTSASWAGVSGKPSSYPPSAHTHAWSAISSKPTSFAPSAHTHPWSQITGAPSSYPPAPHSHAVADVSGLAGRLGTLEQDTGYRELNSITPGLTGGNFVIRRRGAVVTAMLYNVTLTSESSAWQQTGFLPAGFRPGGVSYVYFACGAASSGFTAGPFRVDKYGGVTVYDAPGKTVAVTATWTTDDPFPVVLPGAPA